MNRIATAIEPKGYLKGEILKILIEKYPQIDPRTIETVALTEKKSMNAYDDEDLLVEIVSMKLENLSMDIIQESKIVRVDSKKNVHSFKAFEHTNNNVTKEGTLQRKKDTTNNHKFNQYVISFLLNNKYSGRSMVSENDRSVEDKV